MHEMHALPLPVSQAAPRWIATASAYINIASVSVITFDRDSATIHLHAVPGGEPIHYTVYGDEATGLRRLMADLATPLNLL